MTAPTILDWDTLDDTQQRTLILSPAPQVQVGAELVNPDLTVLEDITDDLKISGDVHWAADAVVHRDAEFTITRELAWGNAMVRLSYTMTDPVTRLSARRYVGCFCLHTPDQVLGENVTVPGSMHTIAWSVQGQDRLYLLDRQVGSSYVVPSGEDILSAILALFADAGLPSGTVLIDGEFQGKTIPSDMTWPLIPGTVADAQDTDSNGPATWLDIANDLCKMAAYEPVWADHRGYYRIGPAVDPTTAPPSFTFDATDPATSSVAPDRTRSLDVYGAPNRWIFTQDNLASGVPPVVGAGLYIVDNLSDGPSSQAGRNGLIVPTQISVTAIDQAALVAQGDLQVAADKRATATYSCKTPPFPPFGHRDVYRVLDVFGTAIVQATEVRLPLDGGQTEWTMQQVAFS